MIYNIELFARDPNICQLCTKPEQEGIATTLTGMDAVFYSLEPTNLVKARQVKQSMMQELLTSRFGGRRFLFIPNYLIVYG